MTKVDKLIKSIFAGKLISYSQAEKILLQLDFELRVRGSHHVFSKRGYFKNVSLKKRSQLLPYQIEMIKEVLIDHGY